MILNQCAINYTYILLVFATSSIEASEKRLFLFLLPCSLSLVPPFRKRLNGSGMSDMNLGTSPPLSRFDSPDLVGPGLASLLYGSLILWSCITCEFAKRSCDWSLANHGGKLFLVLSGSLDPCLLSWDQWWLSSFGRDRSYSEDRPCSFLISSVWKKPQGSLSGLPLL